MKQYAFKMDALMSSHIQEPIRDLYDVILIVLNSLSYISWQPPCKDDAGDFKIIINKMNRMFFVQKEKIFSITIPFTVRENNQGEIEIYDSDVLIDSKHLAIANKIFTMLKESASYDVIDYQHLLDDEIIELEDGMIVKRLVNRLITNEYGYLRYDEDFVHANGDLHPPFHLDINYSNSGTYKLGIDSQIDFEWFRDCLDITVPCKYIKNS